MRLVAEFQCAGLERVVGNLLAAFRLSRHSSRKRGRGRVTRWIFSHARTGSANEGVIESCGFVESQDSARIKEKKLIAYRNRTRAEKLSTYSSLKIASFMAPYNGTPVAIIFVLFIKAGSPPKNRPPLDSGALTAAAVDSLPPP